MTEHSFDEINAVSMTSSVYEQIITTVLTALPNEACGVMLGTAAAGGIRIDQFIPIRNVAPNPLHSFVLDPGQFIPLCFHPNMVGLFHSHPATMPEPSAADYEQLQGFGSLFKIYLLGRPLPQLSKIELNSYLITRDHSSTYQLKQVALRTT
ncbi:Mov34/MPN/PAD-1 family protein [Paenibacillus sediminis]|uniref:Proteasome lid subunit RPN8/RPN11 n=1 Tax=Paenibacillus sediminis TaxID=664909 RepID=A0ABS4H6P9_9BACL|nr:Mov34/MPN/PAD-1 family protein [Paenibacillus sediminis]MBP1937735.1 proteasome lid subunit RPN8/RPN11 [Paenibacillus sediminis]